MHTNVSNQVKVWSEIVYEAKKAIVQDRGEINIERWAKSSPHIVKGCWKQEANRKPEILKWCSIEKYLPLLSAVPWTLLLPKSVSAGEFCWVSEGEDVQKPELPLPNLRKRAMSTENDNMVYRIPQGWGCLFLNHFFSFFASFFPQEVLSLSHSFLSIV